MLAVCCGGSGDMHGIRSVVEPPGACISVPSGRPSGGTVDNRLGPYISRPAWLIFSAASGGTVDNRLGPYISRPAWLIFSAASGGTVDNRLGPYISRPA